MDGAQRTSVTLRMCFAEIPFSPDFRDRIDASRMSLLQEGKKGSAISIDENEACAIGILLHE